MAANCSASHAYTGILDDSRSVIWCSEIYVFPRLSFYQHRRLHEPTRPVTSAGQGPFSSSGHLAVKISSVLLNAPVLIPALISFICCGPEKISHHVCTRTVSEPRPAFCISLMSGDGARGRVFHRPAQAFCASSCLPQWVGSCLSPQVRDAEAGGVKGSGPTVSHWPTWTSTLRLMIWCVVLWLAQTAACLPITVSAREWQANNGRLHIHARFFFFFFYSNQMVIKNPDDPV